ncbi:hypothetical protein A2160_01575 [Candidatus Beckwithbacteria bacterium RBG_13_42_9]|uniref:Endonuclease/exonuclease/phosphatase domain-containing protein n=1 Tax=Candidatus Beckwithbacteria bacterium RBG_13_42_9 TaxID=1797457 RepID=A0A1F5E9E2_9BACT|nr:MAG: hypothetical protein A2160_01575 [Candidatus Beckwithbacteria bacterium RBG_13_42_9]
MSLKFLQLNIYKGRLLDKIIAFLKREQFDIIQLQEVCSGRFWEQRLDLFQELKNSLPDYHGELAVSWRLKNDPDSYFGNATFVKSHIKVVSKQTLWLKPYQEFANPLNTRYELYSRCALILDIKISNQPLVIINTHLAWGPTPYDKPFKQKQAKHLISYLRQLKKLFILAGDFNLIPETKIIKSFDKLGQNLTVENGITNTLNPKFHRVKQLFPKGLAVDYIFTHSEIRVKNFELIKEDLSDHYGLRLKFDS